MTDARYKVVHADEDGLYHCMPRCVRRAFLCGWDAASRKKYDHRKVWIEERLKFLSSVFLIECLSYAVMSNHLHVLLRTTMAPLKRLPAEEIARRWLLLYPKWRYENGEPAEPEEYEVQELARSRHRIKVLRARLGSISWYMKSLDENIARRANIEDGCTGRFWEGRFKCTRLDTEAAVLSCAIYIDLNPVRAKVAGTPEESLFTSVYERIKARKAKETLSDVAKGRKTLSKRALKKTRKEATRDKWLTPIGTPESPLKLSLPEYLSLLDWAGREVHKNKRGAIPADIAPILQRVGIRGGNFLDGAMLFGKRFHKVAADVKTMQEAAENAGQAWYHGSRFARKLFTKPVGS